MKKNKICPTCELPIPTEKQMVITCSEYHVRCIRCNWPVAKTMMNKDGICDMCKTSCERAKK